MSQIIEKLKFIIKKNIYFIHFSHKIISYFGINFEEEYKISKLLNKNDLIVDVGAHLGESIMGFKRYNKDVIIQSFEPNPSVFKKLSNKISMKNGVFLNNNLLMSNKKKLNFYVPKINNISMPYMGSFNKEFIIQRFKHFFFFSIENKISWEIYNIESNRLDDFELNPKIIKIDTEGSELEVLKGSENTLKKFEPLIIVEFNLNNYKSIYEYLSNLNYSLHKYIADKFIEMDYQELISYEKYQNQRNLIFKTEKFNI